MTAQKTAAKETIIWLANEIKMQTICADESIITNFMVSAT